MTRRPDRPVTPWVWLGLAGIAILYLAAIVRLHPANFFGVTQDDTIYFSSARALTAGSGYVLPSVPGTPPATKYPILYPWILSWVWRWNPSFPANLRDALGITRCLRARLRRAGILVSSAAPRDRQRGSAVANRFLRPTTDRPVLQREPQFRHPLRGHGARGHAPRGPCRAARCPCGKRIRLWHCVRASHTASRPRRPHRAGNHRCGVGAPRLETGRNFCLVHGALFCVAGLASGSFLALWRARGF